MPTRTAEEIRQDIAIWQEALAKNTSAGGLSETGDAEALLNAKEAMLAGPVAHVLKGASDVALAFIKPVGPDTDHVVRAAKAIKYAYGGINDTLAAGFETDTASRGAAAVKVVAALAGQSWKDGVTGAANLVDGGSKLIHDPSVANAFDAAAKTTEATGNLIEATGGVAPPFIAQAAAIKGAIAHGVEAAHQYRQTSDAIAEAETGETSHAAAWATHSDYIHQKLQALHSELASVQHPHAGGHVMADTGGNAHQAAELAAQHANQAGVHEHEAQTAAQHAATHEQEAQTAAQHAATHEHEAQTATTHATTHEHSAQQAHDHLMQLYAHAQDLVQQIEALKQHAEAAAAAAQHYAG